MTKLGMTYSPKDLRKDPGIPNLWPFKEEFIKQIEEKKENKLKKSIENKNNQKINMESYLKNVQEKNSVEDTVKSSKVGKDSTKRAYFKELLKVISQSDVVLEVLDARDPMGCRCLQLENMILSQYSDKKIILVLNKIDLIPKENAQEWLTYLRKFYPTVPFKASTQEQRHRLGQSKLSINTPNTQSESLGTDNLMKLLKNYCRSLDIKKSIIVGITGYPNVGKSSLINSLKREKACQTGSIPGITKQTQSIHLDKNIKLLDSPGIILSTNQSDCSLILRNCINIDSLNDPIEPINYILSLCNVQQICQIYEIAAYDSTEEFLSFVAKRRGHIKKGGIIDTEVSARSVLRDWNSGLIPFYTQPPRQTPEGNVKLVSDFSKTFELEDFLKLEDTKMLEALNKTDLDFITLKPTNPEENVDFESVKEECTEPILKLAPFQKKTKNSHPTVIQSKKTSDPMNPQTNKENKKKSQMKKKKNKTERKSCGKECLRLELWFYLFKDNEMEIEDNYNFETEFVPLIEESSL